MVTPIIGEKHPSPRKKLDNLVGIEPTSINCMYEYYTISSKDSSNHILLKLRMIGAFLK